MVEHEKDFGRSHDPVRAELEKTSENFQKTDRTKRDL